MTKRELEIASQKSNIPIVIKWEPHMAADSLSERGLSLFEFLTKTFGAAAGNNMNASSASMQNRGNSLGIKFLSCERRRVVPTLYIHAFLEWYYNYNLVVNAGCTDEIEVLTKANNFAEVIFQKYFSCGFNNLGMIPPPEFEIRYLRGVRAARAARESSGRDRGNQQGDENDGSNRVTYFPPSEYTCSPCDMPDDRTLLVRSALEVGIPADHIQLFLNEIWTEISDNNFSANAQSAIARMAGFVGIQMTNRPGVLAQVRRKDQYFKFKEKEIPIVFVENQNSPGSRLKFNGCQNQEVCVGYLKEALLDV